MKSIFFRHIRLSLGRSLFWCQIAVGLAGLTLALVGCGPIVNPDVACSAPPTPTPTPPAQPPSLVSARVASSSLSLIISGHSSAVYALAASPSIGPSTTGSFSLDRYVASGSLDNTVLVTNVTKKCKLLSYSGHSSAVNAVAWSPDGKYIASGSDDGAVQIWTLDGKEAFPRFHYGTAVRAVAWSSDGQELAFGGDAGAVDVWKPSEGQPITIAHYPGVVRTLAWSPSARIAFGGDAGTINVVDANGAPDPAISPPYYGYAVRAVAWSSDGSELAFGGDAGTVKVEDVNTAQVVNSFDYGSVVNAVAWSADQFVAFGGNSGRVQVWDLREGITSAPNIPSYPSIVRAMAWMANGLLAFGGDDNTVYIVAV